MWYVKEIAGIAPVGLLGVVVSGLSDTYSYPVGGIGCDGEVQPGFSFYEQVEEGGCLR